jgi:PPOX class probable F420-dependent enzyme
VGEVISSPSGVPVAEELADQWPFDPSAAPYVSLATFRRDGREVRTPVWIAGGGGHYFVFSEGDAGKVKRIRVNPRVRLAACNVRGVLTSEWLEGRASIARQPEVIRRAYEALHGKYGWQMKLADVLSKLSGRYPKRAILAIVVEPPV